LEKIGRREISLISSNDLGDVFFYWNYIGNLKNVYGKISCLMHLLNNFTRTGDKLDLANLTNFEGI